ncbi:hypothetical protein M0802_000928 [Mischocyttarus mexicanus]|nr:hypothetical protein M0802_000928 [Mischocyttarus mexicanus]
MDQGFPGQHTTTTVTTTTTTIQTNVRFDPSYMRTLPGILKIVQVILNFLGFICITVSIYSSHSRGGWFNTVAMGGFWFTGVLLEFIFCSIWTVFYLLAASLAADYGRLSESFAVAAFFGFCAMVAYGYDAWLKFTAVRSGILAQGQHMPKQVSTVTSPAY